MTILEAKQALIQRAIEFRNKYPVGRRTHSVGEQVAQRKAQREKQASERESTEYASNDAGQAEDEFYRQFTIKIDQEWEQKLTSRTKSSLPQEVRTLNAQGSCSLTFFRNIRQTSFGDARCPEEKQRFNQAFDEFDAFKPETSSWTPTPNLMRTAGAVLACVLAVSSAHLCFGLLFVAAVLLYCNDSNSPYFKPTMIDEAFSEDALEGMLVLTPG
jgi:hypothetical protein